MAVSGMDMLAIVKSVIVIRKGGILAWLGAVISHFSYLDNLNLECLNHQAENNPPSMIFQV